MQFFFKGFLPLLLKLATLACRIGKIEIQVSRQHQPDFWVSLRMLKQMQ